MQYHIWTLGCQMNVADSQLLASELEKLGHQSTQNGDDAEIMVVNTCVVRQSAEDKGLGRLHLLAKIKKAHPGKSDRRYGLHGWCAGSALDAAALALCRCIHAAFGPGAYGQFSQGADVRSGCARSGGAGA